MTGSALIAEARRAGVRLSLLGRNRITWECAGDPPPDLIERIRAAKTAVLAALAVEMCEAQDWRSMFEERAAIREFDGGLSRAQAEAGARQDLAQHWRDRHPLPARSRAEGCAYCGGQVGLPDGVTVLAEGGHAWVHGHCWRPMESARQMAAEAAVRLLVGTEDGPR